MADGDECFEAGQSGASLTYPMQCSALRKNGFVILKKRPCKIVEMTTSKTGKHGHAKVHLIGLDIFTQKKYEDICPSTHNMEVPNVRRTEYLVIDINEENYCSLMQADGSSTRDDLKIEGEVGCAVGDVQKVINANSEDDEVVATVLCAMGEEVIIKVDIKRK